MHLLIRFVHLLATHSGTILEIERNGIDSNRHVLLGPTCILFKE